MAFFKTSTRVCVYPRIMTTFVAGNNRSLNKMSKTQNIIKKGIDNNFENSNLYEFSRDLILNSRKLVFQTANFAMVETYWRIGEKIVEEQGGIKRAKYGDDLISGLSKKLTAEFGK